MHQVLQLAVSVAASDAPVLITGPNGSGKEKLAEIVQANSRRRDRPFVKVNAGGFPGELIDAELFGAEPGAFTGATKLRTGRFEAADGGTLFLDELGNLPAAGQMKLLRVLQSGEFERLGSSVTRRADVRIISATNVDLTRAIAAGAFREDLYFRLNVIELYVPPLAQRSEDILPLAEHFLRGLGAAGAEPRELSPAASTALLHHDWPGNVRELQNKLQRATLVSSGAPITPEDLDLGSSTERKRPSGTRPATTDELDVDSARDREAIQAVLVRCGGVVSRAAAELGVSRQALYRRMERLGIVLERRPR
jgi:DNA-binding NtrC family response regulator